MFEELEIYEGKPPEGADHDEVTGHVSATVASAKLRCWQCGGLFPIMGAIREDVFYVCCHCHSLNQPDFSDQRRNSSLGYHRLQGTYRPPAVLETVFLRGPGGSLFEMSREDAERSRVAPDRFADMEHPPYILDRDEVAGHHKTVTGSASDPSAWTYHRDWQHGCYFDEGSGQFCVGFHRHPYGDERAAGALETDFV